MNTVFQASSLWTSTHQQVMVVKLSTVEQYLQLRTAMITKSDITALNYQQGFK